MAAEVVWQWMHRSRHISWNLSCSVCFRGFSLNGVCMVCTCVVDHRPLGGSQHEIEGGDSPDKDELAAGVLDFPVS